MSYIHDALKKAQKQKDSVGGTYDGVVTEKKGVRSLSPRTWGLVSLAFLSLLAIIIFLWLNQKHTTITLPRESTRAEATVSERPFAKNQEDPQPLYNEALGHQKNGRLRDAKSTYLRVLKVDPNFVFALNNLGVIYMNERNFFEARRLFEKAVKLKPDYVDSHYNLACLCAQVNNPSGSAGHLKTAIGLDKRVREWARADRDLIRLHGHPEYEKVVRGE